MKMLKKLALVSAVSMISAGAFAMEAMDDETMSATTGQDGITINIVPDQLTRTQLTGMGVTSATMNQISNNAPAYKGLSISEIRVHDDDGVGAAGAATANSGALVIGGGLGAVTETQDRTVIFAKGDKPIQLNIDMVGDSNGSAAGGGAMLNVEAKLPTTAIKLGNIYVANSNAAEAGRDADGTLNAALAEVDGTSVSNKVKILDGLEIVLGESTMVIQLGNEDSNNHMITANSTLIGGLTLNNFKLYDEDGSAATTVDDLLLGNTPTSGGNIRASSIKIVNNDGTGANLTANSGIDVGSRIANTPATVSTASKDALASALSGGAFTTYANAVAAGAAGAAVVAAVDYRQGLVETAAATAGNWGGVDTYNGLVITSQLGDATGGANVSINNLALGDSNAAIMGDVQIIGLRLGTSKIVIMGH